MKVATRVVSSLTTALSGEEGTQELADVYAFFLSSVSPSNPSHTLCLQTTVDAGDSLPVWRR